MIIMWLLHFNPINMILKYIIIKFEDFTMIMSVIKREINEKMYHKKAEKKYIYEGISEDEEAKIHFSETDSDDIELPSEEYLAKIRKEMADLFAKRNQEEHKKEKQVSI